MKNSRGQAALEYMLILGTVMVIVLIGYRVFLPKTQAASDLYFNRVSHGITDSGPLCGNGHPDAGENAENCCVDFTIHGKGTCAIPQ